MCIEMVMDWAKRWTLGGGVLVTGVSLVLIQKLASQTSALVVVMELRMGELGEHGIGLGGKGCLHNCVGRMWTVWFYSLLLYHSYLMPHYYSHFVKLACGQG
jgi:hypothetical protein